MSTLNEILPISPQYVNRIAWDQIGDDVVETVKAIRDVHDARIPELADLIRSYAKAEADKSSDVLLAAVQNSIITYVTRQTVTTTAASTSVLSSTPVEVKPVVSASVRVPGIQQVTVERDTFAPNYNIVAPKEVIVDPNSTEFDDDDLNGECFVVRSEGETLVAKAGYQVVFGKDLGRAKQGQVMHKVEYTQAEVFAFIRNNADYLRAADPNVSASDAAKIAYIRLLCAQNGVVSPDFDPAANHVFYNDAIDLPQYNYNARLGDYGQFLTKSVRALIRRLFTDMVCCVAYMFRVRGHHYLPEIETNYVRLWNRCLHTDGELPVRWQFLATYALHAIMPNMLDAFWKYCVDMQCIAGTLRKRYDSAPAGSAGVLALKKGVEDIQILLPQAIEVAKAQKQALDHAVDAVSASRWGASVNSQYYGAPRVRVDEGAIGVLAAVVLSIYERLAPAAPLRQSAALIRLSNNAPATGGAVGRIVANTVGDERMRIRAAALVGE